MSNKESHNFRRGSVKKRLFLMTIVLFVSILLPLESFSQIVAPQELLPVGAIARLRDKISIARDIAYSPDGKSIAIGHGGGTIIYDTSTYEEIGSLRSGGIDSVAFSPDGKILVSVGDNYNSSIWYLQTGGFRQLSVGSLQVVAYSPDGLTFATGSGSRNDELRIWDPQTGLPLHSFVRGNITSLAYSPDGRIIASNDRWSESSIRLSDAKTGELLLDIDAPRVYCLAYSPDGLTLASGTAHQSDADETVNLWDVKTREKLQTFTGHTYAIRSVAFSPDGLTLASAGVDETVFLWDVKTGKALNKFIGHTNGIHSVAFSRDGSILASGGDDSQVFFWGLSSNAPQPVAPQPREPDLDVNDDGTVNILDLVQLAWRMENGDYFEGEDVNADGVINILDLVQVAGAIGL